MNERRQLRDIAIVRGGDKGDDCHVVIVAQDTAAFDAIWAQVTPDVVKSFLVDEVKGDVERYALPNIDGINFVLRNALGGGLARNWVLDRRMPLAVRVADIEITLDNSSSQPDIE
jgi:hypothetical protein